MNNDFLANLLDFINHTSPIIGMVLLIILVIGTAIAIVGFLIYGKRFLTYGFKQEKNNNFDPKLDTLISDVKDIKRKIKNIESSFRVLIGILMDKKDKKGNNILSNEQKEQFEKSFECSGE